MATPEDIKHNQQPFEFKDFLPVKPPHTITDTVHNVSPTGAHQVAACRLAAAPSTQPLGHQYVALSVELSDKTVIGHQTTADCRSGARLGE